MSWSLAVMAAWDAVLIAWFAVELVLDSRSAR